MELELLEEVRNFSSSGTGRMVGLIWLVVELMITNMSTINNKIDALVKKRVLCSVSNGVARISASHMILSGYMMRLYRIGSVGRIELVAFGQ